MLIRFIQRIRKIFSKDQNIAASDEEKLSEVNRSFEECREFLQNKITEIKGTDWILINGFANVVCVDNPYELFPEILENCRTLPIVMIVNRNTAQLEFYAAKWLLRDF